MPRSTPRAATPRTRSVPAARPAKTDSRSSAQETYLDELIRTRTRVAIFLVNGVKLEGEIRSYDRFVIIMGNSVSDKVYKHAVSTIMPANAAHTAPKSEERSSPRPTIIRRTGGATRG